MDRWVALALAAASVALATSAQAEDKRCQLETVGELTVSTAGPQVVTGSEVSVLTPRAAARAGVSKSSPGVVRAGKLQGSGREKITSYVDVFDSFSFGDETIKNAKLWIADMFYADVDVGAATTTIPKKGVDEPDMLLGADFFKSHRVYVSLQQHKVDVSYAGGPVFDITARPQDAQTVTEGPNPVGGSN